MSVVLVLFSEVLRFLLLICIANKFQRKWMKFNFCKSKHLKNDIRATCLTRNSVTVMLDNPQTSLWTIFIGTTFTKEIVPIKTVHTEVCHNITRNNCKLRVGHSSRSSISMKWNSCLCLSLCGWLLMFASFTPLPTLYVGCQCGMVRVFQSSVEDRVNIQSSHWCPLLSSFSQDDSHPLQHSW